MEPEILFDAIESAIATATKRNYSMNIDTKVKIDRNTGDYRTYRRWLVFADDSRDLEDPDIELRMIDALEINKKMVWSIVPTRISKWTCLLTENTIKYNHLASLLI